MLSFWKKISLLKFKDSLQWNGMNGWCLFAFYTDNIFRNEDMEKAIWAEGRGWADLGWSPPCDRGKC